MKKQAAFLGLVLLVLLSACNNPIVIPAGLAVTLPPDQDFILRATATRLPVTLTATAAPATPAAATLTLPAPTVTATFTPIPTLKSPFPVAQSTPLIDMGFQVISPELVPQLKPVFTALMAIPRHAAISGDGQKLFLSTSDGTFLFNRQGIILAHWQNIFTAPIACESCISTNLDGSRLAVITRNAGAWEAQMYEVQGDQAILSLTLPVDRGYKGAQNEANIALSPDNSFLAFKGGTGHLRVIDLQTNLQVLDFVRPVNGIRFTPDGSRFVIHAGLEMLFFKVKDWQLQVNLLLPREDTPYAFSPDGRFMAIALPTFLRLYALDAMKVTQEINVPPSNATMREWQIIFTANNRLSGYAVRWDANQANATIESGQWDTQTGKSINFVTSTGNAPDPLSALWGNTLTLPVAKSDLEMGSFTYNAFRFVSDGMLLINSPHSACWMKIFTGENTCFKDPEHILFASDANTFREVMDPSISYLLEYRGGNMTIAVGPYPIAAINRSGEWALVDNGFGTDLYTKGKKLPQESVKGKLQGYAENASQIVFTALENENTFTITVVEKATGNTLYQKKDNFLYKPVLMAADGTIYYTQNELEHNQTVFNFIDPKTREIREMIRLPLSSGPTALALSSSGVLAAGLRDGSILIMTRDGGQNTTFQAATSPVEALSFSPDGRFLAVASSEGVRIFSVPPGAK